MRFFGYVLVSLLAAACAPGQQLRLDGREKWIVGASEIVEIVEAGIRFKGRVDTGAASCSIHAEDIRVELAGDSQGNKISFRIINETGQSRLINTRIASVVKVKTSEGEEVRYKVPMTLKWNHVEKTVLVTLNDRQKLKYRLLLGRNWLYGDYVVDVEKNSTE